MAYGVTRLDATRTVARMTHSPTMSPTTFFEVYGRGAIAQAASENWRNLNVTGLHVLDLRTVREDGTHWDLSLASHRRDAIRLLHEQIPDWVSCAPPCTALSSLDYGLH